MVLNFFQHHILRAVCGQMSESVRESVSQQTEGRYISFCSKLKKHLFPKFPSQDCSGPSSLPEQGRDMFSQGEERKKSIRGRITSIIQQWVKDIFFPYLYSTYLGGKISFEKGGGEEYHFLGKYIPLEQGALPHRRHLLCGRQSRGLTHLQEVFRIILVFPDHLDFPDPDNFGLSWSFGFPGSGSFWSSRIRIGQRNTIFYNTHYVTTY